MSAYYLCARYIILCWSKIQHFCSVLRRYKLSPQLFFKCENISDTCIDLLKLANYYKIRVTIHRDELQSLQELGEALFQSTGVRLSESWVAKYSMFDAKRKVILKKGYIVEVENCNKKWILVNLVQRLKDLTRSDSLYSKI